MFSILAPLFLFPSIEIPRIILQILFVILFFPHSKYWNGRTFSLDRNGKRRKFRKGNSPKFKIYFGQAFGIFFIILPKFWQMRPNTCPVGVASFLQLSANVVLNYRLTLQDEKVKGQNINIEHGVIEIKWMLISNHLLLGA